MQRRHPDSRDRSLIRLLPAPAAAVKRRRPARLGRVCCCRSPGPTGGGEFQNPPPQEEEWHCRGTLAMEVACWPGRDQPPLRTELLSLWCLHTAWFAQKQQLAERRQPLSPRTLQPTCSWSSHGEDVGRGHSQSGLRSIQGTRGGPCRSSSCSLRAKFRSKQLLRKRMKQVF